MPLYYENRADKTLQLDKPDAGGFLMPLKLPTSILRRRKSWNASLQRRSIFSPQMNGCAPLQRTFVEHYSDLWTSGKGDVVCLNKVTCVRMYNYVQEYWRAKIRNWKPGRGSDPAGSTGLAVNWHG